MTSIQDEMKSDAMKPRPGFLWAAAVACVLAVATYASEDVMVGTRGEGALAYAFLLGLFVLLAMALVLCYRSPALGNRLLGYDIVLKKPSKIQKSSLNYTGTFHVETGLQEKQMGTQRKQARHARRKLAEVTRQMQAEADQEKAESKPEEK